MLLRRLLGLAAKGLLRRRLRSTITLISVIVGTAGLLLFLSVALGLQQQLQVQLGNYEPATVLHVDPPLSVSSSVPTSGPPPGIDAATLQKLRSLPRVRLAFAEAQLGGTASINGAGVPLELRPVPSSYLSGGAGVHLLNGQLFTDDHAQVMVVTAGFLQLVVGQPAAGGAGGPRGAAATPPSGASQALPVDLGGWVGKTIPFAAQSPDGQDAPPVDLRIVGIIDGRAPFGYIPYDAGMAMLPTSPGSPSGGYDAAVVVAARVQDVATVRQEIDTLKLHVETSDTLAKSLSDALGTARLVAAIIAAIALVLAVVNIINMLLAAVAERAREIGIMKAIGARSWHVGMLFLLESLLLGVLGGVLGGLIAQAFSRIVFAIKPIQLPDSPPLSLSFPVPVLIGTVVAVTIVSGLAGLVPALRAARIDPVTAIAGTN